MHVIDDCEAGSGDWKLEVAFSDGQSFTLFDKAEVASGGNYMINQHWVTQLNFPFDISCHLREYDNDAFGLAAAWDEVGLKTKTIENEGSYQFKFKSGEGEVDVDCTVRYMSTDMPSGRASEGVVKSGLEAEASRSRPAIFEHIEFGGKRQDLTAGRYDVTQITLGNDVVSSVKVPQGWRVTLYLDSGFKGASKALVADARSLPDFNDKTSSILVEETARPIVYEHIGFAGRSQTLSAGRYNIGSLVIGNDVISSVRVPNGWRVTLYQHANFGGATKVLTSDAQSIRGFNDLTSSIVVERL
ncbi:MAG: hypothetical protein IPK80_03935 [Nannocystis sp.]|nr:hypothetical protein [Nannocystis sp.]